MKQIFRLKTMLLLCALMAGAGSAWADDTFVRITSTDDVDTEGEYLIVYESGSKAMGVVNSSNHGTAVDVTISSNTITLTSSSAANIITLNGNESGYTLKGSQDNAYIGYNSSTNFKTQTATPTANAYKWTFSFNNNGYVKIRNVGTNDRYFNWGSSDFRPYQTSSFNLKLYKKINSSNTAAVTFSPEAGTYDSSQTITLSTSVSDDHYPYIYYTLDGTEPTDNNYDGYKFSNVYYNILDEEEPLVVSSTCTVKARVYDTYDWDNPSEVCEAAYTITTPSPIINASNVNITANATSGTITYTVDNADGSTMTAAKTAGEWISNVAVDATNNKVTFDATANTGAERTGAIRLTYGTATKDVTVTQAAAEYTVTIVTPDNGTLEVKNGNTAVSTGDKFAVGTVLTVTATPNTGYKFRNWQAVDGSTHTYTTATTYTMGESNVTLKANFDEIVSYVVSWSVNGVVVRTDDVEENTAITFPTTISGIPSGYTLQGWVVEANKISGTQNSAPTYVTSATCTADITYYAVMAILVPGNIVTITDVITNTTTGVGTTTTYSGWSGKTATSSAVYSGNTAGSNGTIQMRSSDNSGIITTASGGKLKKVTVDWYSGTSAGRTLDIYGKNTAYTATSQLYNSSNQGTKLGSIVKGTSTELTITGDYTYLGLRSNDKAMYLSTITIEWTTGTPDTYSNYCTTVPSVTVTVGSKGYATMVNSEHALDFTGKSIKAYTITSTNGSALTLTQKPLVAQNEPVLLYSATNSDSQNIPIIPSATADSNNKLVKGNGTDNPITWTESTKYYVLNTTNTPGFYRANASPVATNKAYLDLTTLNTGARSFTLNFDEEATAIENVNANVNLNLNGEVYDLQGRRVAQPQKGLYIINGKKVVVK